MMQSSPPQLPQLVISTLCTVEQILGLIEAVDTLSRDGDHAKAGVAMQAAFHAAADMRPVVRGVIHAQRQAAEVRDASERTDSTVSRVLRRQPQEHLNAANDKGHPVSNRQPDPAA